MGGVFAKGVQIRSSHPLSKSDKKKIAAKLEGSLDVKQEYTICMLSNKIQLIKHGAETLFFKDRDILFPTLRNFDINRHKYVTVNEGAVRPIESGADVMAPGILLFEEKCPSFENEEVLGVYVVDRGIFAVGISLVSSQEMKASRSGPVVRILHVAGDMVDSGAI